MKLLLRIGLFFMLLLLLLYSSSTATVTAAVSSTIESATIHDGGFIGPAPAASEFMQVVEVREKFTLETVVHVHALSFMEKAPILRNQVPYFLRIMESDSNKEKVIMTFIPRLRTSFTDFFLKALYAMKDLFLEAFGAILEPLPFPISLKSLPSKNTSDKALVSPFSKTTLKDAVPGSNAIMENGANFMNVAQMLTEKGVYDILKIMDCDEHNHLQLRGFQGLWLGIGLLNALIWILILISKLMTPTDYSSWSGHGSSWTLYSVTGLMYAHKEKTDRNYSRFVINVVTIIVLVLVVGCVARWTSIRTLEKLRPTSSIDSKEFGVYPNPSRSLLATRTNFTKTTVRRETVLHKMNSNGAPAHVDGSKGSAEVVSVGTTDHMKLRIAVPVKNGFHEFIKVDWDSKSNYSSVSGFTVDVFKEVMEALPYHVSCEFIPYENGREDDTKYYDDLIYQLHLQRYDGVVGDVTLTAKRLEYGDFSMPYMMSGVAMIVPIEEENDVNSLWWFFKPLSMEMWLITITLFVSKGILVWIFEHRNNEEFQGTPSEQVGKILSFTFSIFVFAQKEKLESNYSRFIVNLWTFAVFVIVTIYAANVSLMLSTGTPQLTVTSLDNLIEKGDYVGYQKGSFVFDLLKQWGFQESKLKAYATKEEYATALLQGSDNNGVSAIVDEIPYIRVFLTHYGHQYAMSSLTHITRGFGFVFARGSKIAHTVSIAILELEEKGIISRIKKRWFDPITCLNPPQSPGAIKMLGPSNFRGLFLITEVATGAALFLFIVIYTYACLKESIQRRWEGMRTTLSCFYKEWRATSSQPTVEISGINQQIGTA